MSEQRKLWISMGKGNLGVIRQQGEMTWTDFCARQRNAVPLPVTRAEYAELTNDKKAALKKALGFSLAAKYRGNARKGLDIEHRDALNIDLDKLPPEEYAAVLVRAQALAIAYLHVGSASNEVNGKRSGRLIIPLNRSVTPKEFPAVSRKLAEKLGIESVDPVSHQINQICYDSARCSDASEVFEENAGAWLDADAVLSEYADWRDTAQWPRTGRELSVAGETALLGDPCEKPGLVGALNRRYDVIAAIETFDLPYESTADERRWTPLGASSSGGARIYGHPKDPGAAAWMFNSHTHGLSPQKNLCSYDAVRLHRFSALDKDAPADTPVSKLPSSLAMDAWLRAEHPDVVADAERAQAADAPIFEDLDAKEGAQPSAEAPKAEQRERFKSAPISKRAKRPKLGWIVKDILRCGTESGLFYGVHGTGKTLTALSLVLDAARGVPWLGRFKITKQCRSLYLLGEGGGDFHERVQAYARHHNVRLEDLDDKVVVIDEVPDLRKIADVNELIKRLPPGPWDMLFIDTFARATPGSKENDAEHMSLAMEHIKRIHQATGAAVVALHHPGKDLSRGPRGSSAIPAALDMELEISREPNGTRRARITKQRAGKDGVEFSFDLVDVSLGELDEDGEEITSPVLRLREEAATGKRAKPPTAPGQRAVWDVLHEAGGFLSIEDVLDHAVRKLVRDPKKPDRRRQYVNEAIGQLSGKDIVCVSDDEISLTTISPAEINAEKKSRAEAKEEWETAEAKEAERLAAEQRRKEREQTTMEKRANREAKAQERKARKPRKPPNAPAAATTAPQPKPPAAPNGAAVWIDDESPPAAATNSTDLGGQKLPLRVYEHRHPGVKERAFRTAYELCDIGFTTKPGRNGDVIFVVNMPVDAAAYKALVVKVTERINNPGARAAQ